MAIQLKSEIALVNDVRDLLLAQQTQITQNANAISLLANQTQIDEITGELSTLQAELLVQANAISTKVSQTDYTGNTIASKINQTATTIKLQASKIALEGLTTINNKFKVLLDGTIEAVDGKFSGVLTATSGVMNNVNINTGTIGRFSISGSNLVYTSELFNKDYDHSDLARLQYILAYGVTPTAYEKAVYDFNNSGTLTNLDFVTLDLYLKGLEPNPNKKIRSVITIGTTSGEIKTSTVAENGAVGASFIMRADKLSGNLVNTKGFSTEKMYLNGKEVTVDANGFLKAL